MSVESLDGPRGIRENWGRRRTSLDGVHEVGRREARCTGHQSVILETPLAINPAAGRTLDSTPTFGKNQRGRTGQEAP